MALVLNYDEKSLDKRESLWNFQSHWSNLTVDLNFGRMDEDSSRISQYLCWNHKYNRSNA